MADKPLEQPLAEDKDPAPKKSRGGLLSLIKVIAFVSVVVIVEIVAASMLAPTAQETERLGQQFAAATAGITAEDEHAGDDHQGHHEHGDVREVELGVYNITRFSPKTNSTLAIDFELYGIVLAEEVEEFQHSFENSQARIREQVIMTLHGAETTDLTDAGLGLIKRRILEKTNRALGQPLLEDVLFSKFNFVER
jgi:flagellar FliL protein